LTPGWVSHYDSPLPDTLADVGSGVPRPHLLGDAVTACRVASADASQLDAAALGEPAGS